MELIAEEVRASRYTQTLRNVCVLDRPRMLTELHAANTESIGHYNTLIGVSPAFEVRRKIYSARTCFLPLRHGWFFQVLIDYHDGLQWINVCPEDVQYKVMP